MQRPDKISPAARVLSFGLRRKKYLHPLPRELTASLTAELRGVSFNFIVVNQHRSICFIEERLTKGGGSCSLRGFRRVSGTKIFPGRSFWRPGME